MTEVLALLLLQNSTKQFLCFNKLDADIVIQVPLLCQPLRPVVAVQDPKHACNTAANQLLSGAQCISIGWFHANISHLAQILDEPDSLLYTGEVLNCDQQDNGRAYQTLNSNTLEESLQSPQHTSLTIYLFLFGKLTNAWLNMTMNHLEQIQSAWTTIFFMHVAQQAQ